MFSQSSGNGNWQPIVKHSALIKHSAGRDGRDGHLLVGRLRLDDEAHERDRGGPLGHRPYRGCAHGELLP
eukprot:3088801-Prymnesium_polylepis.1